jgi:hypothetical protein
MNKIVFILFLGLGLGDFTYGLYTGDEISMVVGPLIVAITVYIAWSKNG